MSPRVLVVDDDAAVRRTLVNTMTRCGYDAVSASDVTGALVLVGSEELDAVLCDFHIGLESGLDVVRACRARHGQNLFIAMLTTTRRGRSPPAPAPTSCWPSRCPRPSSGRTSARRSRIVARPDPIALVPSPCELDHGK